MFSCGNIAQKKIVKDWKRLVTKSIFLLSVKSTIAEAKGPINIAGKAYATQRREVEIADPVVSKSLIKKTKFIMFIESCERI